MFSFVFWILAIWFVVNVIWMWFVLNNQTIQKTFAWINVAAIIIGFWVFYGVSHQPGALATVFIWMNWINIVVAIIQFYFGYRKND
ncbi:hypothetical protein FP435_07425 [Lactobacillus sp. PV037]|uniref:hypothetical protein n=1 Tax=unclassified Lactobacillus TaxID=2620435 RepID=UPI00223F5CD4|nr:MULTISPECIES: hypothetical protein [unclassified Lactobacillus]QNQ81694.1 hypothetical protein FP433_00825 [Lactobacillus sp. PV012]QNQ84259.1 hypothetical protein FP435_07425 [Lactobacillus sp. PV037]